MTTLQKIAIGLGSGLLVGSVSTVLSTNGKVINT